MRTTHTTDTGAVSLSRVSVDRMLAGNPTKYALASRIRALEYTAEDIARFCPWPALEESLLHDAARLAKALKETT